MSVIVILKSKNLNKNFRFLVNIITTVVQVSIYEQENLTLYLRKLC